MKLKQVFPQTRMSETIQVLYNDTRYGDKKFLSKQSKLSTWDVKLHSW